MWFLKRKPLVALGIDISRYSIEICALTSERDVVAYERVAMGEGSLQISNVAENDMLRMNLDQALAKLYTRAGNLHGVRVVTNIPEQHTYVRYFDVPVDVSGNDLLLHLQKEAGKVIPLEPRDMTATYVVLGKPEKSKATKRVLFAATRKDITRTILEAFHAVGIDDPVLDIESMALMRSLLPAKSQPGAVCILDGGSEVSSIHIFEGLSAPVVSVAYPEGGVHATRRIAEKLKLSFEEAEKMKHAFGFLKAPRVPLESGAKTSTADDTVAGEISSILHDWYQPLLSEFHKTIAFYEAHENKRVSHVILSGGAALLPGIIPYSTTWMERPVRVGNPLGNLRNSEILGKDKPSVLYAVGIGLALRGIDSSAAGVDFTHGVISETKNKFSLVSKQWMVFMLALLAAILVAAALYGVSSFFNNDSVYLYERPHD